MSVTPCFTISRKPATAAKFAIGFTLLNSKINDGLMPPPISLGARAVGWIDQELDQVLAAMIAGKSQDQIKTLVSHLVDQRQSMEMGANNNAS